jgi:hypothetical protein
MVASRCWISVGLVPGLEAPDRSTVTAAAMGIAIRAPIGPSAVPATTEMRIFPLV